MASPASVSSEDSEKNERAKNLEAAKPEEQKPLDFSDFANAVEMSPAMQRIAEALGRENTKDQQKFLERAWDLAADELVAMVKARKEGPEIGELLDFQDKINKILEKNGAAGDQEVAGETDLDETVSLRKKK